MTFRRQVRLAWAAGGIAALALGPVVAFAVARDAAGQGLPLPEWLYLAVLGVLWLALVAVLFLGIARPLHRRLWLSLARPWWLSFGARGRRLMLAGPLAPAVRWWLHLDVSGADRDGVGHGRAG